MPHFPPILVPWHAWAFTPLSSSILLLERWAKWLSHWFNPSQLIHHHESEVFEPLLCISSFSFPSPLFLGNLWDVTDRDIDRYTEALLQGWLRAGSGAPLLYYVSQARQAPRLKYLIGAAPVAYGLPVSLR